MASTASVESGRERASACPVFPTQSTALADPLSGNALHQQCKLSDLLCGQALFSCAQEQMCITDTCTIYDFNILAVGYRAVAASARQTLLERSDFHPDLHMLIICKPKVY